MSQDASVKPSGIERRLTAIVAIVVLIGLGIFMRYMLQHTSDPEPDWNRAALIYGGAEAIGFAAAGFLFGREVNRARAESAESAAKEATTANTAATANAASATRDADILKQVVDRARAEVGLLEGHVDSHESAIRRALPSPAGVTSYRAFVSQAAAAAPGQQAPAGGTQEIEIDVSALDSVRKQVARISGILDATPR